MATVINNPNPGSDSSGISTLLVGLILVLIMMLIAVYLGFPYLHGHTSLNVNNNTPPANGGGTNIQVPGKIDVNVKTQSGQQ